MAPVIEAEWSVKSLRYLSATHIESGCPAEVGSGCAATHPWVGFIQEVLAMV